MEISFSGNRFVPAREQMHIDRIVLVIVEVDRVVIALSGSILIIHMLLVEVEPICQMLASREYTFEVRMPT